MGSFRGLLGWVLGCAELVMEGKAFVSFQGPSSQTDRTPRDGRASPSCHRANVHIKSDSRLR